MSAKPPLILKHGNGYRILSAVSDAMAKAKWSYADGRAWLRKARRLTYEELLEACHRDFSVTIASSFSQRPEDWVADEAKPEELELIPE